MRDRRREIAERAHDHLLAANACRQLTVHAVEMRAGAGSPWIAEACHGWVEQYEQEEAQHRSRSARWALRYDRHCQALAKHRTSNGTGS